MDSRRFRRNRSAELLDQARWLGWIMLMMFVLTQIVSGADIRHLPLRRVTPLEAMREAPTAYHPGEGAHDF